MSRKILLIGVTGVFGNRLARHLIKWNELELVVTSRNLAKAQEAVRQLRLLAPEARLSAIAFDTKTDIENQLAQIEPFCVIDCSGPFQESGHDVAKSVLAMGSHMLDLADARTYLQDYKLKLDDTAKHNSVTGLAGASSTPALSSAVVDQLTQNWQRVDTIELCITPGGQSEVGQSVLAAILSYAGKKVPVWNEGKLTCAHGWLRSKSISIPELGRRRIAPVDTFDAAFLGPKHNVRSSVKFSAGLESNLEQAGTGLIAFLVRTGLLKNTQVLVPLLLKARKFTALFTGDTGAMMVVVTGLNDDGVFTSARWLLLARQDHGPFVPILPAAAALRTLINDGLDAGAYLALEHLDLAMIKNEMKPYSITTQSDVAQLHTGLFPAVLGTKKYAQLPQIVRRFHNADGPAVWEGEADVETSRNFLVAFVARLLGFPKASKNIPLCVTVERQAGHDQNDLLCEKWTRNFAGRRFSSKLESKREGDCVEKFGPLSFSIGLDVKDNCLIMPVTGWRFASIPLPVFLAPRSQASESQDADGRFQFDVKLTLPLLGLFAHYRGWLMPKGD